MAMSRTLPTAILRLAADRVRLTPPAPAGQPPRRDRAPVGEWRAMRSLPLAPAARSPARPGLRAPPAPPPGVPAGRGAGHADAAALERLAVRTGARALRGGGHVLVAEWGGR